MSEQPTASVSPTSADPSGSMPPKIRLTLKLSRSDSPLGHAPSASSAATPTASIPVKIKKKPKKKARVLNIDGKKHRGKLKHGGLETFTGSASSVGLATGDSIKTSQPMLSQFVEVIAAVREQQRIVARKWQQIALPITNLGGSIMHVPVWVRETSPAATLANPSPSHKLPRDPTLAQPDQGDLPTTYVCTYAGCHKIFDTKQKWRRHEHVHRKKIQKRLQFKIYTGPSLPQSDEVE